MKLACQEMKAAFARNEAVCTRVLGLFQLIANKTRFRIICLLLRGEFCVGEICDVVGQGGLTNVSQQLKALALAGIVERRRERRNILYRLADPRVRDLVMFLQRQFLAEETPAIPAPETSLPGGRAGAGMRPRRRLPAGRRRA